MQWLELDMEQQTGSNKKGVRQGYILSPSLFDLYAKYIMRNPGLESRLPGEILITSDMKMTAK